MDYCQEMIIISSIISSIIIALSDYFDPMRSKPGRNPEKVLHVGRNRRHGMGPEERRWPSAARPGSSEGGGNEEHPGLPPNLKSETSLFVGSRPPFEMDRPGVNADSLPFVKDSNK